jgi:excisionase family DNA binding protein
MVGVVGIFPSEPLDHVARAWVTDRVVVRLAASECNRRLVACSSHRGVEVKRGRQREPRLTDPANHPRRTVCLRVAAEYLEIDERTVRARLDEGELFGFKSGKAYRIEVSELVAYREKCRSVFPEQPHNQHSR